MKTIGLIGGLSWESSAEYYRIINETVRERLGGLHSADCLLYSFDFAEIEALQVAGDWDAATQRMIDAAQALERGGADGVLICSNTMHRMAGDLQAAIDIPLLHIAAATGQAIAADGYQRIGLLGTRFTMEQDFYKGYLVEHFGLDLRIPSEAQRATVHQIIYDELVQGVIRADSRRAYQEVIEALQAGGAEAVILGCTEIELLISEPSHSRLPTYPTTTLHALAAVDWALAE